MSSVSTVCYGAGLLGGLYLLCAPSSKLGRTAPRWMRMALWLSGAAFVVWSALGFLTIFGHSILSPRDTITIRQIKTVIGGAGGGIVVLLFASGEFVRAFSKRQPSPPG